MERQIRKYASTAPLILPIPSEEWRPVVGFEGLYSVSNLGRAMRHSQHKRPDRRHNGRILTVRYSRRRYGQIHLMRDGKTTDRYIHCLVAEAFIGPRPEGQQVNHLDGNRRHNAVANLEYCTRSENVRHAIKTRLRKSAKGGRRVLPDFARFAL